MAMAREELSRFEEAFDRLPKDYQDVIILSRLAEMSHGEIATALGRTEGATRNLLYRALARFAELWSEPEA
jgi:RNA polymerase sigma-70 factor (ECF subfamily)